MNQFVPGLNNKFPFILRYQKEHAGFNTWMKVILLNMICAALHDNALPILIKANHTIDIGTFLLLSTHQF